MCLTEMEQLFENLFKYSRSDIPCGVDSMTYFAVKSLMNKYEILLQKPSNIRFLKMVQENFPNVEYVAEYKASKKRANITLFYLIKSILEQPGSTPEDAIRELKEYCIIFKKDKALDEVYETLDVMKVLSGSGRRQSLFRIQSYPPDKRTSFNKFIKNDLAGFIRYISDDKINVEYMYLAPDHLVLMTEVSFRLELEEILVLIDFLENQEKKAAVTQLMNKKRKELREIIKNHFLIGEFQYSYYGWGNHARVYLFEDWYKELKLSRRNTSSLVKHRYSFYPTRYKEHCNELVFNPNFKNLTYEKILDSMFKTIENLNTMKNKEKMED